MRLLIATTFLCLSTLSISSVHAADEYEVVKQETMHTGAAGFDKRHKSYAEYIMKKRQGGTDEAQAVTEIEPASGSEAKSEDTALKVEHASSRGFNE